MQAPTTPRPRHHTTSQTPVKAKPVAAGPSSHHTTGTAWKDATPARPEPLLRFIVDSARLRVEDTYVQCGDAVGLYAEGAGEPGEALRWLRRYVKAAQARGVLPSWWTESNNTALFRLACDSTSITVNGRKHNFCIRFAVEAHDVAAVWGKEGVAQLRQFATRILGSVHDPLSETWLSDEGFGSDDEYDSEDDDDERGEYDSEDSEDENDSEGYRR